MLAERTVNAATATTTDTPTADRGADDVSAPAGGVSPSTKTGADIPANDAAGNNMSQDVVATVEGEVDKSDVTGEALEGGGGGCDRGKR